MIKQRSPLYLAHSSLALSSEAVDDHPSRCNIVLQPEEAARYVAELLKSLQDIAGNAQLDVLAELIEAARDEAALHFPV